MHKYFCVCFMVHILDFPGRPDSQQSACNARDPESIPCWKDPLEKGMATHSSILAWRISMDRGAWWAIVHRVAKSQTRLSDFHSLTHSWSTERIWPVHWPDSALTKTKRKILMDIQSQLKCYLWESSVCMICAKILPFVSKSDTRWYLSIYKFSSVQSLSRVWLFATPWTAAHQASLSITNSRNPPKPISIVSVMPSNHLILCCPLLLLPSIFPSIRVFSSEWVLRIRWPKCS